MQSLPARVVVLATGGTIAGTSARAGDDLGYRAATLPIATLLEGVAADGVELESEQVAQIDSKDLTPAIWQRLAARVAAHAARPEVSGIVVTHGTDTLEETAWLLERVLAPTKPVVLTGAMRPATSARPDGPANLADAIALAAAPGWAGVVAVLAGEVHAAGDVRKTHPHRLDAFASGDAGPLARIEAGRIRRLRAGAPAEPLGLATLPGDAAAWPWVEIVTSGAAADARLVALLVDAGVDGLVVAATGNGTVHAALEAGLRAAQERGVAVLRASRCSEGTVAEPAGPAEPAGAAEPLPLAAGLTPAQARVELMLRLLAGAAAPRKRRAALRRRRA